MLNIEIFFTIKYQIYLGNNAVTFVLHVEIAVKFCFFLIYKCMVYISNKKKKRPHLQVTTAVVGQLVKHTSVVSFDQDELFRVIYNCNMCKYTRFYLSGYASPDMVLKALLGHYFTITLVLFTSTTRLSSCPCYTIHILGRVKQ